MSRAMIDTLLSTEQLSDYLQVPVPTLTTWRSRGAGPRYVKAGKLVRYRVADVEAWLQKQVGGADGDRSTQ